MTVVEERALTAALRRVSDGFRRHTRPLAAPVLDEHGALVDGGCAPIPELAPRP